MVLCVCYPHLPSEGPLGQGSQNSYASPPLYPACSRYSLKYVLVNQWHWRLHHVLCVQSSCSKLMLLSPPKGLSSDKAGRRQGMVRPSWLLLLWHYVTAHLFSFVPSLRLKYLENTTTQRSISKQWTWKEQLCGLDGASKLYQQELLV